MIKYRKYFSTIVLLLAFHIHVTSQTCANKFISTIYTGISFDSIDKTASSNNEILAIGGLSDFNNAGHIAKFTAKGSPIWSYTYSIAYYSFYPPTFFKTIYFKDIIPTTDGGSIVTGSFDQVLSPWGNPPPVKKFALIAKLDKFGKVLWNRSFANTGDLSISSIISTNDGGYIAYLATDNGTKKLILDHSYSKLIKLDANGKIIWSKLLFTYLYDAGGLGVDFKQGLLQLKNKNIILAHVVHKTGLDNSFYKTLPGSLHFLEFDYNNGNIIWESIYDYKVPNYDLLFTPNIAGITEMPNGNLNFFTSLYITTPSKPALSKTGVNIITSSKGIVEKIKAFNISGTNTSSIDEMVIETNANTLLLNKGNSTILLNVTKDGIFNWANSYSNSQYPVNCFSKEKKGYIMFAGKFNSKTFKLLITDEVGNVDCASTPANVIIEDAIINLKDTTITSSVNMNLDSYTDYEYPLQRIEPYSLEKNIECQQSFNCCNDYFDSTIQNTITLCEGKQFTLPDGAIVKDSGTYYVSTKSALGCDSIKLYQIKIDKDVSKLSLGKDTCLTKQNNLTLTATPGFNEYFWQNNLMPDSNHITINKTGLYWVNVKNSCGSKTDSINIFTECDFIIYMPNVFTPNGDGLNDVFGIPSQNKNKLISFKIVNRWGQIVFTTTTPNKKWDGRYKNDIASSDTYIYYIEMEGLSGKRITSKGSFILLK